MPSIFSRIISGELPARFVHQDDQCVAFLSANPIRCGHLLVVPRQEVDHWLDASSDLMAHLWKVSNGLGKAIVKACSPVKVGVAVVGLEVRHLHIHLIPIDGPEDMDFKRAMTHPDQAQMDEVAQKLRTEFQAAI